MECAMSLKWCHDFGCFWVDKTALGDLVKFFFSQDFAKDRYGVSAMVQSQEKLGWYKQSKSKVILSSTFMLFLLA